MRLIQNPQSEPFRLQQYRSKDAPFEGRLFSCARPGRSLGPTLMPITDHVVKDWVAGLPAIRPLHIVSLLGKKPPPKSISEYLFYSFCGGHESEQNRNGSLTFQEWLNQHFGPNQFIVIDFPTIDTQEIEVETLFAICAKVKSLLASACTVVIVDSGGVGRTGKVCKAVHAKPL